MPLRLRFTLLATLSHAAFWGLGIVLAHLLSAGVWMLVLLALAPLSGGLVAARRGANFREVCLGHVFGSLGPGILGPYGDTPLFFFTPLTFAAPLFALPLLDMRLHSRLDDAPGAESALGAGAVLAAGIYLSCLLAGGRWGGLTPLGTAVAATFGAVGLGATLIGKTRVGVWLGCSGLLGGLLCLGLALLHGRPFG